jgi:hypothetical protein
MKELDLSGSPPHPATLEEAHQVIDQLWSIVRALRERVESLEEQLKVDSSCRWRSKPA